MTDLKNLKKSVDTAFNDITVSRELKEKTMKRLHRERTSWARWTLIPAVCAGAILITVASTKGLPGFNGQPQSADAGNTGISTMAASTEANSKKPADSTFNSGAQVLQTWNVASMDEAKKYIGGAVLAPLYIPDGYQVKEILAAGPKTGDAISVVMEFESKGRTFTIQQEKVQKKMDLPNSRKVDINGVEGYINSFKNDDVNNPIYNTNLRWYIGDMMYLLQGSVSEEEAIRTAKSLK